MPELFELKEKPSLPEVTLIAGWRQWADAGSTSSGLPEYLVNMTGARSIGSIRSEGFYLFQFPGTHDLLRPVVKFLNGYPESLTAPRNDYFYAPQTQPGFVFFLGDEPHMNIEGYSSAFFHAARQLGVKRIIGMGGVYGELPFDKERSISCIYSLPHLKEALQNLAVTFSDYHGGASIESYLCKRAGEQEIEFISFYAFVPVYDFTQVANINSTVQIENDFMAWLGVMRRINYLQKADFDLSDLEQKSIHLVKTVNEKMDELDRLAPQIGIRDYLSRIAEDFTETPFNPLDDFWESKLRKILGENDTLPPPNPDDPPGDHQGDQPED
jgi:hypothetical protein